MEININTPKFEQQNKKYNYNNQQTFTGLADNTTALLRFLDTNQAIGANCVDLGSMVIPRTTVDFINRGPDAGTETARRESMGTINHSSVGLYGTFAGLMIAAGLNNKYGIKAHKIFADNHTIDTIAQSWHDAQKASDPLKEHVKTFVNSIRVLNTDTEKTTGHISIPEKDKQEIIDALYNQLKNSKDQTIDKDFAKSMHAMITASTGGEKTVYLLSKDNKEAQNTLKTLISNFYNTTKAFSTGKAVEAFKNSADVNGNELVKALKKMNITRSAIGLGIATAIGVSTQPINMYLTKKKTGKDGFVGVEGREKDNSSEFKMMKTIGALIFAGGALATITTNPKKFLSKIQFQGMLPTIDQLKLVYGMTIASRLLAARDKDELRESAVKDSLGFLNLLILGSLVTKGAARGLDKTLVNETVSKGKSWFGKFADSSLKTRDEVLLPLLKKNGINVVKDGKAVPFKDLMKEVSKLNPDEQKAIKKKLRALNIAQIVGYLYSGLVLGVGIPKLNIYMTNKSEAKRKAKLAQAKADNANPVFSSENQDFLKSKYKSFISA
ncbi:hypothetical protein J6E39_06420 [bacterium]|nr:hypothetical protein [bacterium]